METLTGRSQFLMPAYAANSKAIIIIIIIFDSSGSV